MIEFLRGVAEPKTIEDATRTLQARWYSGAAVRRYDWWNDEEWMLQFSMEKGAYDLKRFNDGAPLLKDHMPFLDEQVGAVKRAWVEGGEGLAEIQFSAREEIAPLWQDVKSGIVKGVSMGVSIRQTKDITKKGEIKTLLAIDWEPMELSIVAIPADSRAQFLAFESREQFQQYQGRFKQPPAKELSATAAAGADDSARRRIEIERLRFQRITGRK